MKDERIMCPTHMNLTGPVRPRDQKNTNNSFIKGILCIINSTLYHYNVGGRCEDSVYLSSMLPAPSPVLNYTNTTRPSESQHQAAQQCQLHNQAPKITNRSDPCSWSKTRRVSRKNNVATLQSLGSQKTRGQRSRYPHNKNMRVFLRRIMTSSVYTLLSFSTDLHPNHQLSDTGN